MEELITIEPTCGLSILPHWLAQPYFRPAQAQQAAVEKEEVREEVTQGNIQLGTFLSQNCSGVR